jgi:hypothetical protein
VLAVEPALNAGDVLGAVQRAAIGLRQATWLADALEVPDALAASTTTPRVVDRLVAELLALDATQIEAPRCVRCGGRRWLDQRLDGQRACRDCANRERLVVCGRCGRARRVHTRDRAGIPICSPCWRKDPAHWEPCASCGRPRVAARRRSDGAAVCGWCSRPQAVCVECGSVKRGNGVRSGAVPLLGVRATASSLFALRPHGQGERRVGQRPGVHHLSPARSGGQGDL